MSKSISDEKKFNRGDILVNKSSGDSFVVGEKEGEQYVVIATGFVRVKTYQNQLRKIGVADEKEIKWVEERLR